MPSELAAKAIELLSPSVGEFLARAKVLGACMMAKLDIETLDRSQLPEFAEKFELTCRTSLGSELAKSLKQKILNF